MDDPAPHILSTVDSLLHILVKATKTERVYLLGRLKELIPSVASMNEESPLSEEDWKQAELTKVLPWVFDTGFDIKQLPPALDSIVEAVVGRKWSLDEELRKQLFRDILAPIIEKSTENNQRWLSILLNSLGASFPVGLPRLPVRPMLLVKLVQYWPMFMTDLCVHLYGQFVIAKMHPFSELVKINEQVQRSMTDQNSNAGRHWLDLFGHDPYAYAYGGFKLSSLLRPEKLLEMSPDLSNKVPDTIGDHVFFQADRVLQSTTDTFLDEWNAFIKDLEPPLKQDADIQEAWNKFVRPIWDNIRILLPKLEDETGPPLPLQPKILPLIPELDLRLMNYPCLPNLEASERSDKCAGFAGEVSAFIQIIAGQAVLSGVPYHEHFQRLKQMTIKGTLPQDRALIANTIGIGLEISPVFGVEGDLFDHLGVELAAALLMEMERPPSNSAIADAEIILQVWFRSSNRQKRLSAIHVIRTVGCISIESM